MVDDSSQASEPANRVGLVVRWLMRRHRLVILVSTLLAIVAGGRTALTYAALRSDLEALLPESAPSVTSLTVLRQRLPGLRYLGIVIDTGTRERLPVAERFIDELASRIEHYPKDLVGAVRKDGSRERAFAETYAFQLMDPEDVHKLTEAVEERRDWEAASALGTNLLEGEEEAPKIPLDELRTKYENRFGKPRQTAGDRFVSDDGKTAVLLVQVASQSTGYERDAELLKRVKADVKDLGFPDHFSPGMRIGFAGDVATRVEETQGLASDLAISGAVVLLLVVAAIFGYYRSIWALLLLALPLSYGPLFAFGLAALPPLSIRSLNSNTAFLGSIVVGNGVNSGIILLARYWEERKNSVPVARAMETAVATTWQPTLAAALAASVAYGSLVITDFRGFNQFGWIGGIGLFLCWLANYALIPALGAAFGERVNLARFKRVETQRRWQRLLLARPRLVLAVFAAAGSFSLAGLVLHRADWIEYDFSKLRRRDSWVDGERYWGRRMDAALGRYLTPTLIMTQSGDEARLVEARVRRLQERGEAGGLVGDVRSSAQWLPPRRAESLLEAKKLAATITPRMRKSLSEKDQKLLQNALSDAALKLLEPSAVPDVLLTGMREFDGRVDRNVLVYPKLGGATWKAEVLHDYARDLRKAATIDGHPRPVAGSLLLSSDISRAMLADGPRATLVSFVGVLVVCWLAFRGKHEQAAVRRGGALKLSLGATASLLWGVLMMLGGLAAVGQKLNFTNFVALPITFGIAADYSINILKRYQIEERDDIESALFRTGGAVALCSAMTIIGYGSLLMAQNQALFSFGFFAIAGEITCLSTAVLALPAAIAWITRRRAQAERLG